MKIHKPDCMANVACAVFHADGVCPGPYGKCTCDGNETNVQFPMPPNTKKCCGDCGFAQLPPKTGIDCVQPKCPCHTPAVEDWEGKVKSVFEDLREELTNIDYSEKYILDIVRSLRESDRKRIVEGLEKMKGGYPEYREKGSAEFEKAEIYRGQGYDSGLQKAIKFITNLK